MKTEQKDSTRHLSRIVGVSEKTHASSNVEHDSMDVIHRYIPNSSANEAIERFTAGLAFGGSAISITGPYGSGKSTFGIMLNHLAAPDNDEGFVKTLERIDEAYGDVALDIMEGRATANIRKTGMIRCVVTARPEPVATTILRAIINGVESYFGTDYDSFDFTHAGTLRRLSKTAKVPDSGSIIDVITSLAAVSPILLMIDEFGKNIEYFADEGMGGDLFLLQELTEMSGTSRKIPLHIVTMQHMAFGEYVAGTLAGRMKEWGKVQGRFDDVHFSNSLEHTRAVLASSLKPADGSMRRIMEWADRQSESATSDAGVNIDVDLVASCYPLHPLAVEALPELCSRYGQNERTLLSFVSGGGPDTVSRFIDGTMCSDDSDLPTMGIDTLYDYFISGSGSTRAGGATSSRVVEIDTIIRDIQGLDGTRLRTLKAIGILNLIGRSGRLRASVGMLRCVVGPGVEQDIAYLESRSVITYRQHADEYRIWHGTDVNIAAKLDAWRKTKSDMPFHDIMKSAISPAPVVAARHGIEKGTIRIFQCLFDVDNMVIGNDYDGAIVYGSKDTRIREYHKPVIVSRCEDVTPLKTAAVEVSALRSVLQDDDVSSDHVARSETGERLAAAEAALLTEFGRAYGSGTTWTYRKGGIKHPMLGTAGSAASNACTKWYDSTPVIRNEMINRNDLTAQGATARNRLMAAIIKKWGSADPWFDSWSPERAVYDTMIRNNGMHGRPKPTTKSTLHKPWNMALKAMQKTRHAIELEDLYGIWKACPLGMKNGTMPILVLLIIVSKRKSIAVYEHGTYVHRLSAGLAERLAKNPKHFRLKWFKKTKSRDRVVMETASKLRLGSSAEMLDIVSHLVGVVRMLPTYTRRTKRLGKKTLAVRDTVQDAIEPDTLLFESIPHALGMRPLGGNISKNRASRFAGKLGECVDELQGAYDSTLDKMAGVLFSETGTVDRSGVSKAASELLPLVSDHAMKVFLGAVSAEIPNEKSWKEYVGLTLTDKPPADWNDDDVDMFRNRLVEISAGFKRLAALRFSVVAGSLARPSVMVTITHPDGRGNALCFRWMTGASPGSPRGRVSEVLYHTKLAHMDMRHVCGISGGKDSSALTVYMRDRVPDMEYFFCDTGAELPETYKYLAKLEVVLGKPIPRLNSERGFSHYFEMFRGTLPSPQMRWCTSLLKIKPLEDWIGDEVVVSYVAIRADESNRKGYVSTKPNIKTRFPFVEDNVDHAGVIRILEDAGINLPEYYKWRTRSGCYFCFFQRKAEWVGLADNHPDLFEKAVAIEQKTLKDAGVSGDVSFASSGMKGRQYTWSDGETLTELLARRDEIMKRHEKNIARAKSRRKNLPLIDVLSDALDEDDETTPCTVCHL